MVGLRIVSRFRSFSLISDQDRAIQNWLEGAQKVFVYTAKVSVQTDMLAEIAQ